MPPCSWCFFATTRLQLYSHQQITQHGENSGRCPAVCFQASAVEGPHQVRQHQWLPFQPSSQALDLWLHTRWKCAQPWPASAKRSMLLWCHHQGLFVGNCFSSCTPRVRELHPIGAERSQCFWANPAGRNRAAIVQENEIHVQANGRDSFLWWSCTSDSAEPPTEPACGSKFVEVYDPLCRWAARISHAGNGIFCEEQWKCRQEFGGANVGCSL